MQSWTTILEIFLENHSLPIQLHNIKSSNWIPFGFLNFFHPLFCCILGTFVGLKPSPLLLRAFLAFNNSVSHIYFFSLELTQLCITGVKPQYRVEFQVYLNISTPSLPTFSSSLPPMLLAFTIIGSPKSSKRLRLRAQIGPQMTIPDADGRGLLLLLPYSKTFNRQINRARAYEISSCSRGFDNLGVGVPMKCTSLEV